MTDFKIAIQAANEKFQTAQYIIEQQLAADTALAAEPLKAAAQAKVTAAEAALQADLTAATSSLVGTDVVGRLSGGRTRRCTVQGVSLAGDALTYTVLVQGKFTPNYSETVTDYTGNRMSVPYSDEELANSIAYKAKLNSNKGRSPTEAFNKEFSAEKAAFAKFQATQTPAPVAAPVVAPVAG